MLTEALTVGSDRSIDGMAIMFARIILSLTLLWLSSPIAALDEPHSAADTAHEAAPMPPIWRVKDQDTEIYIFGTVHVLRPDTMAFTRVRTNYG